MYLLTRPCFGGTESAQWTVSRTADEKPQLHHAAENRSRLLPNHLISPLCNGRLPRVQRDDPDLTCRNVYFLETYDTLAYLNVAVREFVFYYLF